MMKRIIINNSVKRKTFVREIWIVYNKNGDEKTIYIKQHRSFLFPNLYKPISNLSKFISFDDRLLKGIDVVHFDELPNITINSIIYTDINNIDFDIRDLLLTAKDFLRTIAFFAFSTNYRSTTLFSEEGFSLEQKQCEEIDWIIDKLKLKKS